MPIQLGGNDFLKYHYYPDYLINRDDIDSITDVSKVISSMGINCRSTNLIIDGGNMVPCGPYIVMTDKVFSENRKKKDDWEFKALLDSELGHPVIIIPWTSHEDDVYGHSDGFIKWCGHPSVGFLKVMALKLQKYVSRPKLILLVMSSIGHISTFFR